MADRWQRYCQAQASHPTGWVCTREKGHADEHVASMSDGRYCYSWYDLDPDLLTDGGL